MGLQASYSLDAMRERALELLRRAVGDPRVQFRPGQWEAIQALVERRERLLVVERTGWGKSIVYFIATKLSPLLALMRIGAVDASPAWTAGWGDGGSSVAAPQYRGRNVSGLRDQWRTAWMPCAMVSAIRPLQWRAHDVAVRAGRKCGLADRRIARNNRQMISCSSRGSGRLNAAPLASPDRIGVAS